MFNACSSCPIDRELLRRSRAIGVTLQGLAVVGFEACLRVPVPPLLDGHLQEAQARAATFLRSLSF